MICSVKIYLALCQAECGGVACTDDHSQCCGECGREVCRSANEMCPTTMCADLCFGACNADQTCCQGCPDYTGNFVANCVAGSTCPAIKCLAPWLQPCPRDQPQVECLVAPCGTATCPGAPVGAVCHDWYCGGCNTIWTTTEGTVITCGR
jgi:hypothetical protein